MSQESTFRAVLGAGLLAMIAITLYHRLRSWESKEALDRRQEGVFILATLRPIALLMYIGVFAYLINPAWMAWSSVSLPPWLRWSGAAVVGLGVAMLAWTLRNLGVNLTDTVVTRQAHTLITQGPYRWVRHPFYVALALFVVGFALITANWFIMLTGTIVFVLLAIRSRTEEALLLARFGEPYRAYQQSTGRFVPRWRGSTRGGLWSKRRWAYAAYMLFAITRIPSRTGFRLQAPVCDLQLTMHNVGLSLTKIPHIVLFGVFFLLTVIQFDRIDRRSLSWSFLATIVLGLLVELEEGATRTGNCRLTDVLPDAVGAIAVMVVLLAGLFIRRRALG